jgi:hypothetical protein
MKVIKSIKLTEAQIVKLDKERKKVKPEPSLHAWMVYKLTK